MSGYSSIREAELNTKERRLIETKVGIYVPGHLQSFQKWHCKYLEGVQLTMNTILADLKKQKSPVFT